MIYKPASCALIWNSDYTKFVGISRRNNPEDMNLPGGKADKNECHLEACIREVHEELDLPCTSTVQEGEQNILLTFYEDGFFFLHCYGEVNYQVATFISRVTLDILPPAKEEGFVTKWITWDDLCQDSNSFYAYNKSLRDRWLLRSTFVENIYIIPPKDLETPEVDSCLMKSCATGLAQEKLDIIYNPSTFETLTLKIVSDPSAARFLLKSTGYLRFDILDKCTGIEVSNASWPTFEYLCLNREQFVSKVTTEISLRGTKAEHLFSSIMDDVKKEVFSLFLSAKTAKLDPEMYIPVLEDLLIDIKQQAQQRRLKWNLSN